MNINDLKYISDNIDIDEYFKFTKEVKDTMEHPEWLGTFDKDELIRGLKGDYKVWIYYINKEPVCSMMIMPTTEKTTKKLDLNDYNYKDIVDYGPMMVNIKYVGNKLQYQMLKKLDEYSISNGYKYALVTAHPDNHYSINNLIKDGFIKKGTKTFTRGIRDIYFKQL